MSSVRFCDELPFAFGWIAPDPGWMQRAAHAVAHDGRVWLLDPIDGDGVDERVLALGEPAGVVRMLDRHGRDCEAFAERYGVPLHHVPFGGVTGAPFEVVKVVDLPRWHEVALWWPDGRVLACADVLAGARRYRGPGERVGVHPWLRVKPPRVLAQFDVEHLLLGHGEGVHGGEAVPAVQRALDGARTGIPGFLFGVLRP